MYLLLLLLLLFSFAVLDLEQFALAEEKVIVLFSRSFIILCQCLIPSQLNPERVASEYYVLYTW